MADCVAAAMQAAILTGHGGPEMNAARMRVVSMTRFGEGRLPGHDWRGTLRHRKEGLRTRGAAGRKTVPPIPRAARLISADPGRARHDVAQRGPAWAGVTSG